MFTLFSSFYHSESGNKKNIRSEYEIKKWILELLGKHNILLTDYYTTTENNKTVFFFIQEVHSLEILQFFLEDLKKSDLRDYYYYHFNIGIKMN